MANEPTWLVSVQEKAGMMGNGGAEGSNDCRLSSMPMRSMPGLKMAALVCAVSSDEGGGRLRTD